MKITGKRPSTVKAASFNLIKKFAKKCLRELSKKEHELNIPYAKAVMNLSASSSPFGNYGRGGQKGIWINVYHFERGEGFCWEYASYRKDPVIGECNFGNPEQALFGLVAHEMSHHVQYAYCPNTRMYKSKYRKPHGECFQDLYRILRSRLVNVF